MRFGALALLAVISADADAPARVSDVIVTIVVEGLVPDGREVILSAAPIDPLPHDSRGAVELTSELRSRPILRLGHGRWQLSATADGLWFAPSQMDVIAPATVRLRAWPITQIRGVIDRRLAKQHPPPTRLEASLEIDGLGEPGRFVATELCAVSAASWECSVPATKLTIRLQADGYAPRYLRDVEPSRQGHVASALVLEKGASIVGVVLDGPTQRPDPAAMVEVCAANGDPIGRLSPSSVDRSGHFQIVLRDPGSYVLRATASGRTAASEPIEVSARDDLRLSEPLVLRPPLTLRLAASPPLDPLGQRWRVALYRVQGVEARLVVLRAMASRDGTWSRGGLPEGQYVVRLSTESGALWGGKRIDLSSETDIVDVDVAACLLTGKVTLGGMPLSGRIVFGGDGGPLRIALESNEEGRFEGSVPCRDDLTTRPWKILVESGGVRRLAQGVRLAEAAGAFLADISFTDSAIEVDLFDEVGNRVEGATVTVVDARRPERRDQVGRAEYETEHRSRGKVWLHGLDDGSYLIEARAGRLATSEPTRLQIGTETRRQSLRLVLRADLELTGRVLTDDGSPIQLATVRLVPTQAVFPFAREVQTKADGTFSFRLPAATREVSLLARAYGRSLRLSRVTLAPDETLVVRLASTGGTLVLKHAEPLVAEVGTYVLHEGAFVDSMTLTNWAATHGQAQTAGALVVPQMDQGYYRACRVPTAEAQVLFSGRLPQSCVGGQLNPGGSLFLDVPTPSAAPKNDAEGR